MNSTPTAAGQGDQSQSPDAEASMQGHEGDDDDGEEQEVETTRITLGTGVAATAAAAINGEEGADENGDGEGDHFRVLEAIDDDDGGTDVNEETQDQVDPIRSEEETGTADGNQGVCVSAQQQKNKATDDDKMEVEHKTDENRKTGNTAEDSDEICILDEPDSTTTTTDATDLPALLLDLELECVDEELGEEQLQKGRNLADNFRQMLRDVARIKKRQKIFVNNKVGSQLIGVHKISLVRPAQQAQQQQQPVRFQQQQRMSAQVPGYQPITPRIINRSQQPYTSVQAQYNPQVVPQMIRSTVGGPSLQPLLFDAQSGLLIMPAATASAPVPVTSVVRTYAQAPIVPVTMATVQQQQQAQQQQAHPRMRQVQPRYTARGTPLQVPRVPMASRAIPTRVQPIRSSAPLQQQQQRPAPPTVARMLANATATRPNALGAGIRPGLPSRLAGPSQDKKDDNSKTFPSLVVNVKPCLQDKPSKAELQRARADLDSRVKSLLIHTPSKFTEWLMQRGLLRLEHKCSLHQSEDGLPIQYKLGMYSDGNKQPFSGGYVWISECCPDKQISVFQGSIFESSVYPPGTLFKLFYHWSCQTSATNVLLWVKVTSYYLKNFYTLLRSACVAALHELSPELGGPHKYVEVGIITLGTAMPNSKQTKVEILGVFDPFTKAIRLKVVNPQNNPHSTRVQQILWPLRHWVHKDSVLLIDSGVEKNLLVDMGFANVVQCGKSGGAGAGAGAAAAAASGPTNVNVMNYLKHIVPKMFQNTLCVLSKSLIQQFLDELCWRELWGRTAGECFDNIVSHLVQMTKWEMGEPLITRLNKISLNPFGEWSYNRHRRPGIDMLPDGILHDFVQGAGAEEQPTTSRKEPFIPNLSFSNGAAAKRKQATAPPDPAAALREQHDRFAQLIRTEPRTLYVHNYYYAESIPKNIMPPAGLFPSTLKCPLCTKQFVTNLEVVKHIAMHINSLGMRQGGSVCEYCLKDFGGTAALTSHVQDCHRLPGSSGAEACLICCERFTSPSTLILHMWENHCAQDMPYKCDLCSYKSSFHYEAVDHFAREHKGYDSVLCPHCLKVMPARSFGCLKGIVVHMQSHSIRRSKKCGHCVLVFTSDLEYRAHLTEGVHQEQQENGASPGHITTSYQNDELELKMPTPPSRIHSLPPPVKRARQEEPSKTLNVYKPALRLSDDGRTQIEDFRSKYVLPVGLQLRDCIECGLKMNGANHYPSFASCIKCRFSTSCGKSMEEHLTRVHATEKGELRPGLGIKPTASAELEFELKCDCRYGTKNPVQMAKHLVKCDKYTCRSERVWGEEEQFMERIGLTATTAAAK